MTISDYTFNQGLITFKKREVKNTPKKSKWEMLYDQQLKYSHDAGIVHDYSYESLRFQIGVGATYTPDFLVIRDGRVEIVEVKGYPHIYQGKRRCMVAEGIARDKSILKFKTAAMIYGEEVFCDNCDQVYWRMVELSGREWKTVMMLTMGKKLTKKDIDNVDLQEN